MTPGAIEVFAGIGLVGLGLMVLILSVLDQIRRELRRRPVGFQAHYFSGSGTAGAGETVHVGAADAPAPPRRRHLESVAPEPRRGRLPSEP